MKQLFLAAAALFSSIPGLLIIASGLGTPPNYEVLFGGVIEAFGVIAILVLWVNRNKIKRLPARRLSKFVITLASICVLLLFTYLYFFNQSVVTAGGRGTVYYPLYIDGEIGAMVETAGSRRAALERYGIDEVIEQIDKLPDSYSTFTTVILLFIYQLLFTLLTITFGLLGVHQGHGLDPQANEKKAAI